VSHVRKIIAWVSFDEPVDRETAIQSLGEAVLDEGADMVLYDVDEQPIADEEGE
jgi:hypothetical protein